MEFPQILTDLDPNHDKAFWVLVIGLGIVVAGCFVFGALVRWGWRGFKRWRSNE